MQPTVEIQTPYIPEHNEHAPFTRSWVIDAALRRGKLLLYEDERYSLEHGMGWVDRSSEYETLVSEQSKQMQEYSIPTLQQAENIKSPSELASAIIMGCSEPVSQSFQYDALDRAEIMDTVLERISGWSWAETKGELTPDYSAVRKQTVLEVIELIKDIRVHEDDPEKPVTTRIANMLRSGFLSSSPNMLDYLGGTAANLEVLKALSLVPELQSAYATKCHGMAYDLAFDPECGKIVDTLLDDSSTKEQLISLRLIQDVTSVMQYSAGYDPAEEGAERIADRLWQYVESNKITAWMPNAIAQSIVNRVSMGYADLDSVEGIAQDVVDEERAFAANKRFTGDWAKFRPMQLAPGVYGARSQYGTIEGASIRDSDEGGDLGQCVGLKELFAQKGVEVTDDDIGLFQELHNPGVQGYLEWQLGGIKLSDFDLHSQLRLVNFVGTRPLQEFGRIADISSRMDREEQKQFLSSFLATEFGEDYGNSIMSIAEHATSEQSGRIFETVNDFRRRTHEFASWFRDYDPDFAEATERAMNERLTDALSALEETVVGGKLHVDVAPHRHNPDYYNDGRFMCDVASLDEGIEIIKNLDRSFGLIHDVVTAQDVRVARVNKNDDQFIIYRFTSEISGSALLYIRPEGAHKYDKNYEYGNAMGVEASISFIVNPTEAHHVRSDKDPDAVSIRFDREGRLVDDSPFALDRDPTREDGTISVDISSGLGDTSRLPVKIGRFIAAGNILRARKTGSHESLHHNTNYFDQRKYGKASGFSKLAIYTAHMAEAMIAIQEQGSHRSRYRRLPGILRTEREELKPAA